MEQTGVQDAMVPMEAAGRPPPICMDGEHLEGGDFSCQTSTTVDVAVADRDILSARAAAEASNAEALSAMHARVMELEKDLRQAREQVQRERKENDRLVAQAGKIRRMLRSFCTDAKLLVNEKDRRGLYKLVAGCPFLDAYMDAGALTARVTAKADAGIREVMERKEQQKRVRIKSASSI